MENRIIHIKREDIEDSVVKHFKRICNFDCENKKHKKMEELGFKVREKILEGININILLSDYSSEIYNNGKINIKGQEIDSELLKYIPNNAMKKIYFYLINVGKCNLANEEDIVDAFYADLWGTAYTDAVDEYLRVFIYKELEEEYGKEEIEKLFLTDSQGPGYFGMPMSKTHNMFEVLDADKINVEIRESGLMIPQKSLTGFYCVVNDKSIKFPKECDFCNGNKGGCQICGRYLKYLN